MVLNPGFKAPTVGLDIGSSAVKAVVLRQGKGGWSLVAAGEAPLGEETVESATAAEPAAVREAVGSLLDSLRVRRANVATALAANHVIVKRLAFAEMSEEALMEAIPWEAEQYIPFDLGEVTLDYQVISQQGAETGKPVEVLLVAAKREHIEDRAGTIAQTGRRPIVLDVEAFALANAYQMNYPDRSDALSMLVHVGRSLTVVCLLKRGEPVFTRDIALGGQAHLEAIKQALRAKGVDERRARSIFRGQSSSDLTREQVAAALRQASKTLAAEVRRTVEFYRTTAPAAEKLGRVVLSGGACEAVGLSEQLTAELGAPVSLFDPFRKVARSGREIGAEVSGPAFAVAVGLAMRQEGDR
jgi:type IV pilus assembly protein PilM